MRILIVDDDADFSRLISKYLTPFGECEVAVNGQDAIESVKLAFEEAHPYDFICLDIMMPNLDGQDALKKIRDLEKEKGIGVGEGAKIIMITAMDDDDSRLVSFLRLCDGYLTKPLQKVELFEKLREIELINV
jgi:two-component system chemotaxis response regulator CheY